MQGRIPRNLKGVIHARAVARRELKLRIKRRRRPLKPLTLTGLGGRPDAREYIPRPVVIPESKIQFPETLDFSLLPEETIAFFKDLRQHISKSKTHRVYVDHSSLKEITPEAALVLMAEMFRAHRLFGDCEKLCVLPNEREVRDLLGQVGYYDYFAPLKKTWKPPSGHKRHFFAHRKGTMLEPVVVKGLMALFSEVSALDSEMNSALYEALIECMNNVLEHAYPLTQSRAAKYRFWWMLGYVDTSTRNMSFSFFDQGVGIPRTIRTRWKDSPWLGPLSPTDSELVQTAVLEGGYSSTKRTSKGRGLPTLKRFIDTARDGELSIFANQSMCVFHTDKEPARHDHAANLPGTLIAWNIRS